MSIQAKIDDSSRVNKTDLARILGYAKSYITKLSKQGKISGFDSKGLIVLGEARRQLEAFKDFRRDPQRQAAERSRVEPVDAKVEDLYLDELPEIPAKPDNNTPPAEVGRRTQLAICAKTVAEAQLRLAEYLEKIGALVPREDVVQGLGNIAVVIKSKLEGMPKKLGPMLAGKTAAQVDAILKKEVEALLHELNKQFGSVI